MDQKLNLETFGQKLYFIYSHFLNVFKYDNPRPLKQNKETESKPRQIIDKKMYLQNTITHRNKSCK